MQAVVRDCYGPPARLALREVAVPALRRRRDVLVRVRATCVHVADSFVVRGAPLLVRFAAGLLRPRQRVPGQDVAGEVVAIGDGVSGLRVGDRVFGIADGAWAEFARGEERRLATIPDGLDFAAAAALPTAGLAALHGLRDGARVEAGQRVLVHGASGGVGTCAVQLARFFGAEVTAVCSGRNADLLRSLGAHEVLDYTQTDWTQGGPRYDVILDNIEDRPLAAVRRALAPRGVLLCNSGTGARGLAFLWRLLAPLLLTPFIRQRLRRFLSLPNADDLRLLARLVANGALRPVVERTSPLAATAAALEHVETGRARGRVVIAVPG
jgi:NADPH:quinone reductase-like Zn-dependent oxidoreductase